MIHIYTFNAWLIFFHFMIYDHEKGISHKTATTYFQYGPFYWVDVHIYSPTTQRGAVQKDGAEISEGWSLPECIISSGDPYCPPIFLLIQWRHMLWTENLIPGKVSTSWSSWCDRICDLAQNAKPLNHWSTTNIDIYYIV